MRAVAPNAVRRRRRQHAPGPRRTCFPPDRRSPCRDDPHRECELRAGPARASLSSRHMGKVLRTFESRLSVKPEEAWNWMTSAEGISTELSPILKMTMPKAMSHLSDLEFVPGRRLFRSWTLLFGVLPVDRSDLTLLSLDPGRGFVEESPMISMRYWRHERTVSPTSDGTVLTDRLTFEPRFASSFVIWFITKLFEHRHGVLRRRLGTTH